MPAIGVAIAVSAAGIVAGLVLAEAIMKIGPAGAIAPAVLASGLVLLRYPTAALGVLASSAILIEAQGKGILPPVEAFYNVAGAHLTPQDLLILAGLGGVLLRFAAEGERPQLPDPLVGPLALLAIAVLAGVVTGYTSHVGVQAGDLFHRSLTAFYIILVPLLAVNTVRGTRALHVFLAIGAGLAVFKGISGLYAALGGSGEAVETETISYLNPVPNLTMLIFGLGVVAALIRRVKIPGWMIAGMPIAFLALLLSYRRSFWIAAAFTLVVVIIIASRRRGRAVFAIGAVTLCLAVVGVATVGSSSHAESPIVERAQTLSPSGFGSNRGDRYRNDERRNVIQNLREHPLTGIGLGVPWSVHYPLAESHDRRYAHVAILWFWLAFGPLGVIAYIALFGTALWTAVRVWRRHPDPVVQVAAIACFGGLLALTIVELTATFTAIEVRTSILLGAILGWLAAAWRDLPDPGEEPAGRPALGA
jgi:O-antigen ligase